MNIFQNYDITYNNLKEIDFTSVFYAAFIDTMSPVYKEKGPSQGWSPSDVLGQNIAYAHKNQVAWNAFFGYRANNEEDYDVIKYLRRAGRTGWNFVKLFTEFPVRLLDYGVEKALANSWDATGKFYNNPLPRQNNPYFDNDVALFFRNLAFRFIPWIVTGFASLIFLAIHIPLKITSLIIRSQTSSSTLFAEADAINPTLGKLVRVLSIGLSIAICVAIPVVTPYFAAINANAIAQGLNVIGHGLAVVGEALGVTAGLSAAIAAGAVVTLGAITAVKATINLFSKQFNSLFKKAPATYDTIVSDDGTVALADESVDSQKDYPQNNDNEAEELPGNIQAAFNILNKDSKNLDSIHEYLLSLNAEAIEKLVPEEIKKDDKMKMSFINEVENLKNAINSDGSEALKNFFLELDNNGIFKKLQSYEELADSIIDNSSKYENDDITVASQPYDLQKNTEELLQNRQNSTSSHGYNS